MRRVLLLLLEPKKLLKSLLKLARLRSDISYQSGPLIIAIFITGLLHISTDTAAQDLLVTTSNDSLNCRILKQRSGYVQFEYVNPASNRRQKTILPETQIESIIRNYYKESAVKSKEVTDNNYSKIRLNANVGYGYKLGISSASSEEEIAYEKDIRNGYRFGGEFDVFFNSKNGIGFKFSQFNSKADVNVEVSFDENSDSTETYAASEKLMIAQYSVLWRHRWLSQQSNNSFNLGLGLGVVRYKDQLTFLDLVLYEEAFSVALELELSYDVGISEKLALTFGVDMGTGYFEKSTINYPDGSSESITYPEGKGVSTGRLSLWIGLTFRS